MVTIDSIEYRFSHGKEPKGRGAWAFSEKSNPANGEILWFNGTYAEAKKQAIAYATSHEITKLFVQP